MTRKSRLHSWTELIPVAAVVVIGAAAIALSAHQGPRGITHVFFLSLVLAENTAALLARRRHPLLALAGVLATYLIVDSIATTVLPVLLALFTVTTLRDRRTLGWAAVATALVVIATPLVHREPANFFIQTAGPLVGLGLSVLIGSKRRAAATA